MTDIDWIPLDERYMPEIGKNYLLLFAWEKGDLNPLVLAGKLTEIPGGHKWVIECYAGVRPFASRFDLPFQDISHYSEFNLPDEMLIKEDSCGENHVAI